MFGSLGAETIMKKLDVIEVYSRNNEIHFVLQEHKNNRRRRKRTGFGYTEVKTIMKKKLKNRHYCYAQSD